MSVCTVCHGYGHYMFSRDPDEEDICMCPAGDALRSPGELALKRLYQAFNEERNTMSETWQGAYQRIMAEVEADLPDADEADQYTEYRIRCEAWKFGRGIQ